MNNVILKIDNTDYSGWEQFSYLHRIDALCQNFSFTMPDRWLLNGVSYPIIKEGDEVEIWIDKIKILTGYIDKRTVDINNDSHQINIEGRSKTSDLVDCSIVGVNTHYDNITFSELLGIVCTPFEIGVVLDTSFEDFKFNIDIKPGDTPFDILNKKAREKKLFLKTDKDGNLVVTNNKKTLSPSALKPGFNIKAYSSTFDLSNCFSEYHIFGQDKTKGKSWAESIKGIYGKSTNEIIRRYRPKSLKASMPITAKDAENKAAWEANTGYAKSYSIGITCVGYYQTGFDNLNLWEINQLIKCEIPLLNVNQQLLISEVNFSKSAEGTLTNMLLTMPEAYLADPLESIEKEIKKQNKGSFKIVLPEARKNNEFRKKKSFGVTASW